MPPRFSAFAGTVGTGLWRSRDGGERWEPVRQGLHTEVRVYGLATDPGDAAVLYVGTGDGLWRSGDGGASFARVPSPMDGMEVWRVAVDPSDSGVLYVGTRPAALFRSRDGGATWSRLAAQFPPTCPAVRVPRVTGLAVDPGCPSVVWCGVEVDGVQVSLDHGETWRRVPMPGDETDIHDIAVSPAGRAFVCTPPEIYATDRPGNASGDDAVIPWTALGVRGTFAHPYCRGIALKPDDADTIFIATGDEAVGATGSIQRSTDGGRHWSAAPLPKTPNSPMWTFAVSRADPSTMLSCSHYGQLWISGDAGATWTKSQRELAQTRALALLENRG